MASGHGLGGVSQHNSRQRYQLLLLPLAAMLRQMGW
jgi:hypothetical protein